MEQENHRQIWGEEPNYKIFISHKAEDKLLATRLKDNLKFYKISCFVAHQDIAPTKEWQEQIEITLKTADGFIALLTEKFSESDWTDQEIGYAYARKIPIIPIIIGKTPYGFIGKIQGLKCDLENEFNKIVSLLLGSDPKMLDHYITLVKTSESFDYSNNLSVFLSDINTLSTEQINQLIFAFKHNSQVSDSYGFLGTRPYKGNLISKGLQFELKRITGKDYNNELSEE
jgi:hypothetical protein